MRPPSVSRSEEGLEAGADVALDLLLGAARVARLEHLDDAHVALGQAARVGVRTVDRARRDGQLGPDRVPRGHEQVMVRGLAQPLVEHVVEVARLLRLTGLDRRPHLVDDRAQVTEVLLDAALDDERHGKPLERDAQQGHLMHVWRLDHAVAARAERLHEALLLELAQRLAHRGPAHAEHLGQARLRDAVVAGELTREHRRAHAGVHLVPQVGAGQPLERSAHRSLLLYGMPIAAGAAALPITPTTAITVSAYGRA